MRRSIAWPGTPSRPARGWLSNRNCRVNPAHIGVAVTGSVVTLTGIDLYPGLYEGPRDGQLLYRLPQLTYAMHHPGNTIPALRFAFVITDAV